MLGPPTTDKGAMLEIRGDNKTVVDWLNGHAKLKTLDSTVAPPRIKCGRGGAGVSTCGGVSPAGRYIFFVNTIKKPTLWQG